MDLATATATDLLEGLRAKTVSSRELLDGYLDRIDRLDPELNAVCALDVERARAAADEADRRTAAGDSRGPLHGLPMTIKDVFETDGLMTTSGAPELASYVPDHDAFVVAALRSAGAIIFGKTNVPLYAGDWQTYNEVYGRTNNPWDLARTPGGSSGGAAAAVAAGLSPVEYGSDIGGSIRIPSHCCGLFGLKPSWGVVCGRGHIPPPPGALVEPDVGAFGPIGRSIADLRLLFDLTAGPSPENAAGWRLDLSEGGPIESVAGLRVATVFDQGDELHPLSAEVRQALDAFATRLGDAGAEVEAVPLPVPLRAGLRTWIEMVIPIIGLGLSDDEYAGFVAFRDGEAPGPDADPSLIALRSFTSTYREWAYAESRRQHERHAWAELFERYDVVLAPTMPTVAIPHDTEREIAEREIDVDGVSVPQIMAVAWVGSIGSALLPVVDVPVGNGPSGMPIGVQVVGPYLSDRRLLRLAELVSAAAGPGFVPPPKAV